MRLEEIGFYTLSDERARTASDATPIQRAEVLLTDRCNFKCPYCRGMRDKGDMPLAQLKRTLAILAKQGTRNYRFSGGEPTVYPYLQEAVREVAATADRVALSTNGSARKTVYAALLRAGVNDFSVSLDACCSSVGDTMAGVAGAFDRVVDNIRFLASRTYVTVGVVYTEENKGQVAETIEFAKSLGVADIRVIPAAQHSAALNVSVGAGKHPILKYRLANMQCGRPVRGIRETDSRRCPLVLDDVAIAGSSHYPCIIYLRERGKPIGEIGNDIRERRRVWFEDHDCYMDPICSGNCLDVCVDYNNRWMDLSEFTLPRMDPSQFGWQSWRLGGDFVTTFGASLRWTNMPLLSGKLKASAVGWTPGGSVPCRPKPEQVAVMFRFGDELGWCHLRRSEFHRVFGKTTRGERV